MNDDFSIGIGVEAMTGAFELPPQLKKVIDLAIKNNPDRPVFIEYGLVSANQVNDAEPPHSEAGVLFYKKAFVIGAAMHDGLAHAMDNRFVDPLRLVRAHNSRIAAHGHLLTTAWLSPGTACSR